jgi:hypothetical protein
MVELRLLTLFKLTEKYGKGWGFSTLQHCVRTAYTFTEEEILYAVRTPPTRVHTRGQAAALKQPNGRETSSFAA